MYIWSWNLNKFKNKYTQTNYTLKVVDLKLLKLKANISS